jgi:hypothetical protein
MAQGRLRVEATKLQQCPSKTTQTLESMQQHLFTLQMHTYKVQEAIMAHGQSPHRARWQARLVLQEGTSPSKCWQAEPALHRGVWLAVSSQLIRAGSSICSGRVSYHKAGPL